MIYFIPLAAAEKALRAKETKYADLPQSYIFMPIAMETMGSWACDSLRFLQDLSNRMAAITGEPRSTSFLLQSISMVVQRCNAISILGTVPSSKDFAGVFYLL